MTSKRVLAMLAAVAAIVIGVLVWEQMGHVRVATQEASLRSALFRLRDALDEHVARNGRCPDRIDQLRGPKLPELPMDPLTGSSELWVYTPAGPNGRPCDVKSASPRKPKNGIAYSNW